MERFAVWEVDDHDTPIRLSDHGTFLEQHLESWIEREPSLLMDDVRWVSRQLVLSDGSRLDLLGLTRDGTWVIVELKRGSVDGAAVRQVLHYFLIVDSLPNAEFVRQVRGQGRLDPSDVSDLDELAADPDGHDRDYLLVVAGVGGSESAEAAAAVLDRHRFDVPIRAVSFGSVTSTSGQRLLVRNVYEDLGVRSSASESDTGVDTLFERASELGVLDEFEGIRNDLIRRGYKTYQKPTGLNFNPGSRRQCFWVKPMAGTIHIGYLGGNFHELFGIDERTASERFGENWRTVPPDEARRTIQGWADLIDELRDRDDHE